MLPAIFTLLTGCYTLRKNPDFLSEISTTLVAKKAPNVSVIEYSLISPLRTKIRKIFVQFDFIVRKRHLARFSHIFGKFIFFACERFMLWFLVKYRILLQCVRHMFVLKQECIKYFLGKRVNPSSLFALTMLFIANDVFIAHLSHNLYSSTLTC